MDGFQVWDEKVIRTAMNRFYKDDLSTMIDAIKRNLTVSTSACTQLHAYQFRRQV
jgi:hypothetical protein